MVAGVVLLSSRLSVVRKSCIRWKLPTEPINVASAIISEPRGSERSVKRDKEVNTRAVSSVVSPLLRAITEKTVKVNIGAVIGVMKAN